MDGETGEIVFHLGNISEDILPDGKKQYENGLPVEDLDSFQSSVWGNTPSTQSIIYAFNNIESQRIKQDLGYDGLDDDDEKIIILMVMRMILLEIIINII